MPAPVIMLPNLLERSLCRGLIERFDSSPTMDGEVTRTDADGIVGSVIDHGKKHRRDLFISPDDDIHAMLAATLSAAAALKSPRPFSLMFLI